MSFRRTAGLLGALVLLVAVALLFAWPGPADRSAAGSRGSAGGSARGPGAGQGEGSFGPKGLAGDPDLDRRAEAAVGEAPGRPGETAEAQVDRNVRELLGALAPELDLSALERTCTADGLHCTFTGPWPGDDLLVRWIRAQGSGDALREDLEGVTFSRFRRERDGEGAPILVLQAHAPGANPGLERTDGGTGPTGP